MNLSSLTRAAVNLFPDVPEVLSKLNSAPRILPLVKVQISALTLFAQFQNNSFNNALASLKGFKNILYMTSFVTSSKEFIREDGSCKLLERNSLKNMDWAKFFVMIGDIAEHCSWWNEVDLHHFPLISKIAGNVGRTKVFGYEVKKLFYVEVIYRKAKDFFIVPAAIIKLNRFISEEFNYQRKKDPARSFLDSVVLYSDAASNVGKLFLIPFGKRVGEMGPRGKTICSVVDLATNSLGLIKTIAQIKQEINKSKTNSVVLKRD